MRGDGNGWRRHEWLPDVAVAAGAAAVVEASVAITVGTVAVLDQAVLLVSAAVLAAHRRAPRAVLLVTTACALTYFLRVAPDIDAAFPALVAVYSTVTARHRVVAALAVLPPMVAAVVADLGPVRDQSPLTAVQNGFLLAGWFVAAGVFGEVSAHHRAYLRQVEQRAAEAERTREEAALRRAGEERLRIARELHDSLTHSISIVRLQAGVAVHLARKRGEEVPEALLAIQEASGEAMRELRATLEVLRDGSPADGDAVAGAGLGRVPELVERARSAGLEASVTVTGHRRALPADVDLTAYRIVQEALTNVTRHAAAGSTSVHIGYLDRELVVQVDDDGTADPAAPPLPGVGLVGMRERVTALGGRLRAQPRPEGGFTIRAELPVDAP